MYKNHETALPPLLPATSENPRLVLPKHQGNRPLEPTFLTPGRPAAFPSFNGAGLLEPIECAGHVAFMERRIRGKRLLSSEESKERHWSNPKFDWMPWAIEQPPDFSISPFAEFQPEWEKWMVESPVKAKKQGKATAADLMFSPRKDRKSKGNTGASSALASHIRAFTVAEPESASPGFWVNNPGAFHWQAMRLAKKVYGAEPGELGETEGGISAEGFREKKKLISGYSKDD